MFVKIGIPVASKMTPATGHKNPDMYMVTGYEENGKTWVYISQ